MLTKGYKNTKGAKALLKVNCRFLGSEILGADCNFLP
jgi:hypothetical protein